jgi:hypothetical protein
MENPMHAWVTLLSWTVRGQDTQLSVIRVASCCCWVLSVLADWHSQALVPVETMAGTLEQCCVRAVFCVHADCHFETAFQPVEKMEVTL